MKNVKLFFIILAASMFGCTNTTTTNLNDSVNHNIELRDCVNLVELSSHMGFDCTETVYMDKNTGVLYYTSEARYKKCMTPIYNADGSVMTYSQLKKRKELKTE